jgi:tetratricopeptide (TPR) repeat protein
MTTTTLSLLDQTELLQLAVGASGAGDAGAAIGYLKEAVSRVDCGAFAHYLLGAEYAQIKLYDRAAGEMEAALALDPALSIARLQLGLLWLSGGGAAQATTVLAPLAELPVGDALHQFGAGLGYLMKDQFDDAVRYLEAGIALNTANGALNTDMQRIVDEVARLRADGQLQPADPAAQAEEGAHHVLLSAYTGNTSH